MKRSRFLILFLAMGLVFGVHSFSFATPTLQLTQGVNVVTVADGGLGDMDSLANNVVIYMGSVGVFTINVTTGLTGAALGVSTPYLDLNSINVTTINGGGTLEILFSENDYSYAPANYVFSVGGLAAGSATFEAWLGSNNALFAKTTQIGSTLTYPAGPFSGSTSDSMNLAIPYSLTIDADIVHPGGAQGSSFNAGLTVPEPGILILLGIALSVVGVFSRRTSKI